TVTKPTVTSGENGPSSVDVQSFYFDMSGRIIWSKDADGYVNHITYDPNGSGAVVQSITDAPPYPGNVLSDGPLAYWRLDEASGTTAADLSGDGFNGTYNGSVTLGSSGLLTG